jgi:hypothetical protein
VTAELTVEYRVETSTAGGPWIPEGDHRTFLSRQAATEFLDGRAKWYGNPERFAHRITCRTTTAWMEVAQ